MSTKSILKASPTKISIREPVPHISEVEVIRCEPTEPSYIIKVTLPPPVLMQLTWLPKSLFVKQVNSQKREKQVSNYMMLTLHEDRKKRYDRRRDPLLSPIKGKSKESERTKRVAFDD